MSANEGDFDLREIHPLSRKILSTCGVVAHESSGQQANRKGYRGWFGQLASPKDEAGNLAYPVSAWDTAKSGTGHQANSHM